MDDMEQAVRAADIGAVATTVNVDMSVRIPPTRRERLSMRRVSPTGFPSVRAGRRHDIGERHRGPFASSVAALSRRDSIWPAERRSAAQAGRGTTGPEAATAYRI